MAEPKTRKLVTGEDALIVTQAGGGIPFELMVTMGAVEGYSQIDKFGFNPTITTASDPEDIWENGGIYVYTANGGVTHYVSSSSGGDTQEFTFSVLTEDSNGNWNDETFNQTIAGQTQTQLNPPSGDPIVRVYRVSNNDSSDLVGTLYVYENDTVVGGVPQGGNSTIRAIIDNGNNQTLMALYTIPTGKVGFLFRGEVGMEEEGGAFSGSEFMTMCYKSRRFGQAFTIKKKLTTISDGSSLYQDYRSFPDVIPAKTDIRIVVDEVSATMGAWATFDILLIDEDLLSSDFLDSIGQIRRV